MRLSDDAPGTDEECNRVFKLENDLIGAIEKSGGESSTEMKSAAIFLYLHVWTERRRTVGIGIADSHKALRAPQAHMPRRDMVRRKP
jgi:hypothetical protein